MLMLVTGGMDGRIKEEGNEGSRDRGWLLASEERAGVVWEVNTGPWGKAMANLGDWGSVRARGQGADLPTS
jgi:hypothetical protein